MARPSAYLICILTLTSCAAPGDTSQNARLYRTGNPDFDRMLALSITIAEEILARDASFVPFAAAVRTNGELAAVLTFEPMLTTPEAVNRTVGELSRGALTGLYRATAICTDVIAPIRDNSSRSDAISILLEDEAGSRGFILPYRRTDDGLRFGTAYFRHERSLVFRPATAM